MADRRDYLEHLLYRSMGSRRYTQSSPVLPDVWIAYGMHPGELQDLLLIPHVDSSPGELAQALRERLAADDRRAARIAYNQNTVVAKLGFTQMIRAALPLSGWWRDYLIHGEGAEPVKLYRQDAKKFGDVFQESFAVDDVDRWLARAGGRPQELPAKLSGELFWMARIVGTLALLERAWQPQEIESLPRDQQGDALRQLVADEGRVLKALLELLEGIEPPDLETPPLWSIHRNRPTEESIYRSGNTAKADAVRQLFDVRGKLIRWAVIDSGIDATHLAFRRRNKEGALLGARGKPLAQGSRGPELPPDSDDVSGAGAFYRHPESGKWKNQSRIRATYDFTRVRDLLSGDEETLEGVPDELRERASALGLEDDLRKALKFGSMIDWDLLELLLRVPHDPGYVKPQHHHGTHVAGILGADWRAHEHSESPAVDRLGIAPEIEIFDFRALDEEGRGDEFSIMAAMQFIRHLNSRKTGHNQMEIHGVNLSFSIHHEVSNFACGRTPVCNEAERLVGNGAVVVAAAGNKGWARYRVSSGEDDKGYRSISITDPGNAEAVITVGATHCFEPHTYGVSYFSSRGPTGDGRQKPDLVAPGEKIYSTVPDHGEKDLDGTSMAAPHVSGAAALLMERHLELIGQPARVKQILCGSATDLGRERYFQGAGLLDILRALQSV